MSGACLLFYSFLPSLFDRMFACLFICSECAISYFNGKWFTEQRLWNWMRKDREIFAYITLSTTIKFGISFEMLRIHFACCTFHNKAQVTHVEIASHLNRCVYIYVYAIYNEKAVCQQCSQESINYCLILSESDVAAFLHLKITTKKVKSKIQ